MTFCASKVIDRDGGRRPSSVRAGAMGRAMQNRDRRVSQTGKFRLGNSLTKKLSIA
jgi:hypothetical protein